MKKPPTTKLQDSILEFLALSCYGFIVLGPFIALGIATIQFVDHTQLDWFSMIIPNGRRLQLLFNSLSLATIVALISSLLGWVGAAILWTRPKIRLDRVIWLVLLPIVLPVHVYALVWISLTSNINKLINNSAMGILQGWAGVIWVEAAALAPIALGFAWFGLRGIDPELIAAGRLYRPDLKTLLKIALPLSVPAALTGAGIIFLLSFLDYSIPSLFQVNVYALEIFAEYSASNSPERAFLLALPQFVIAAVVLVFLLEPLRTLTVRRTFQGQLWRIPPRWPGWVSTLGWTFGTVLIIQALLPLSAIIAQTGALKELIPTLRLANADIRYSLWLAAYAGLSSLPIAWGVANALSRDIRASKIIWFVVMTPVALPASLIGVSLIFLVNHMTLAQDFLRSILPVAANMARFLPLAVLIILAQLRRNDPLLFDAARVHQPSALRRLIQVVVPLLAPALLAAAGIIFALSLGELGATLMVIPAGKSTLTMRIYNYLHYGASQAVMGLSLILITSVLLAASIVALLYNFWPRISNPTEPAP